jgi:uncharacterized protein YuzE
MLISYDDKAKAMYVALLHDKVAKTVEFSSETFLDLSSSGELIGVEMLQPNRMDLRKIAKKYRQPELSRIPQKLLKAVA